MSPALVVYRKEMKELLRDKRVRSSVIIMPMLLVVGMLAMFGFISGIGDKENQKVTVVQTKNPLIDALKKSKFQISEAATLAKGKELIQQGKARLVLDFPPDTTAKLAAGKTIKIGAYYDPQQATGQIALAQTKAVFQTMNGAVEKAVLQAHSIPAAAVQPIQLDEHKVLVGKQGVNEMLVSLMPYFIVIWAFFGGMGTAADLVSGEKEKSTLETLLITPVGRSQIAFGKFLALMSICLMGSLSALAGFILAGVSGWSGFAGLFEHGLGFGPAEVGVIVLALIPTVAFFASLLIAISTYAKNPREAQTYLSLVSFIVIMPAVFGQVIGFTDLGSNWWIRLIPVLNTSVTVRDALQGKTNALGLALTVLVGVVLALIAIRIAVRLFRREEVLVRV